MWAPCRPHKPCYQGFFVTTWASSGQYANKYKTLQWRHMGVIAYQIATTRPFVQQHTQANNKYTTNFRNIITENAPLTYKIIMKQSNVFHNTVIIRSRYLAITVLQNNVTIFSSEDEILDVFLFVKNLSLRCSTAGNTWCATYRESIYID